VLAARPIYLQESPGMTANRLLRPFLLLLSSFLLAPNIAKAESSLAEAVKKLDAKYLSVPDLDAKDTAPKIEAGGGGDDTKPAPQEISQDGVKAALSYIEEKSEEGDVTHIPVVTIAADGKEIAKLEGDSTGFSDPPVSVQIAEIDPSNSRPEVVVSFYTGGAHCCSDTSVVTSSADGAAWTTVDVGEFDGAPLLASDLDGDGRYEFATRDNAFLYTFACYACSTAPLEVLAVENGAVKNVTTEPRFKPAHESTLKFIIEEVPDSEVNGFLAGYVGEKILLGEGKEAWNLMLAYYDKTSDWGLESCDKPLDENGECPGKTVKLTFPEALERMLKENGYKVEK
jgi:hypothetical protein